MDYAYHSDMFEQDNRNQELDAEAAATISSLKFCNFGRLDLIKKISCRFFFVKKNVQVVVFWKILIFKIYLAAKSSSFETEEGFDF